MNGRAYVQTMKTPARQAYAARRRTDAREQSDRPWLLLIGLAAAALAAMLLLRPMLSRQAGIMEAAAPAKARPAPVSAADFDMSVDQFVQAYNACRAQGESPMVNNGGGLGVDGAFTGTLAIDSNLSGAYVAADSRLEYVNLTGRCVNGGANGVLTAFRSAVMASGGMDEASAWTMLDEALAAARANTPGTGAGEARGYGLKLSLVLHSAERLSLRIEGNRNQGTGNRQQGTVRIPGLPGFKGTGNRKQGTG